MDIFIEFFLLKVTGDKLMFTQANQIVIVLEIINVPNLFKSNDRMWLLFTIACN